MVERKWHDCGNRALLKFFIELIPPALGVERCSIFILDPEDGNVWLQCGTGVDEKSISVSRLNSIVGEVIDTGVPICENNLDNRVGAHDYIALQTGFFARDTLCVPVKGVSTQQITGAIQVLNKINPFNDVQKYSPHDHRILEHMALHIQLNIEDIYLRQELGKISIEMSRQIEQMQSKFGCAPK